MIIGRLDNKESERGETKTNRGSSGSERGRRACRTSEKISLTSGRLSLCDDAAENPLWRAKFNYASRPENTGSEGKISQAHEKCRFVSIWQISGFYRQDIYFAGDSVAELLADTPN